MLDCRLLYKRETSHMEGGWGLLFSLISYSISYYWFLCSLASIKQVIKYDAPELAVDIAPFIAFHGLNIDEILDPPDSFSKFRKYVF